MKPRAPRLQRRHVILGAAAAAMAPACTQVAKPSQAAVESNAGLFPTLQSFGGQPGQDVSELMAAGQYIVVSNGRFRIGRDAIVPRGATLHFMGGSLEIESGRTLTIEGQVIAPAAQIFFGAGSVEGPPYATEVMPEWFGAVGNGYDANAANDTDAIKKTFNFVQGGVLKLSGMYSIDPEQIELDSLNNGLHVVGNTGGATKYQRNLRDGEAYLSSPTGFCLRRDGEWMFRFGTLGGRALPPLDDTTWDDVLFDGMGRKTHLALLWLYAFRTSKMRGGAVKSCRGPGCFANGCTDITWSGMQFVYLGVPEHQNKYGFAGAFLIGAPAKHARIGNNVLFFNNHCRFEWFDGGLFRAVKEPIESPGYSYNTKSIPSLIHFYFLGNKIEVGRNQGWGETRNDYFVFDFGELDYEVDKEDRSAHHPAAAILISGNELNDITAAKGLIDLGRCRGTQISNNIMSFGAYGRNVRVLLFKLRPGASAFDLSGNTAWVKGSGMPEFEIDDRSGYQINYEPPTLPETN